MWTWTAILYFTVLIIAVQSTCFKFSLDSSLCPYGCLCTLKQSCDTTISNNSQFDADGSCAGLCRRTGSGQCPGDASCRFDAGECVPPPPCIAPPPYKTFRFTLKNQGFPDHPGVLAYIPTTFDSSQPSFSLVVHIHGFHNCIQQCVLPQQSSCNCSVNGARTSAYGLLDSFQAEAEASKARGDNGIAQSIFLVLEVAYDQASSDPGKWAVPGMFSQFLQELLSPPYLGSVIGPRSISDISRIRAFSHSGGYTVIGALATVGGVSSLLEVTLLDSLYGNFNVFDSFVKSNLNRIGLGPQQVRFHSVYTDFGGTANNNREMAARVKTWLGNQTSVFYFDDTLSTIAPQVLQTYPIVFKRVNLSHDDSCRVFFSLLLKYY